MAKVVDCAEDAAALGLEPGPETLDVEWLDPSTGAIQTGAAVTGGSSVSFTPPFVGDAVLYLVDHAGHG